MTFLKKKISEHEAAAVFVLSIFQAVEKAWPDILNDFESYFKNEVAIPNDDFATFNLSLAITSLELSALWNLFPRDQAERLANESMKCIEQMCTSEEYKDYAHEVMQVYTNSISDALDGPESPLEYVSIGLLYLWLGEQIKNFEVEIDGQKTGHLSPVLITVMSGLIAEHIGLGRWKNAKDSLRFIK
ncbi:MAG: hypothetical protein QME41_03860 [Actinomycetota bacterium]|nr:hypothetical protein [Actinomycetota bacterium]